MRFAHRYNPLLLQRLVHQLCTNLFSMGSGHDSICKTCRRANTMLCYGAMTCGWIENPPRLYSYQRVACQAKTTHMREYRRELEKKKVSSFLVLGNKDKDKDNCICVVHQLSVRPEAPPMMSSTGSLRSTVSLCTRRYVLLSDVQQISASTLLLWFWKPLLSMATATIIR